MGAISTLRAVGRPIAYYPRLARHVGGINAALFLCQLIYWDEKAQDQQLGVYKTMDEWEQETGLSHKEQSNARKQLKARGLIIETRKRLQHRMYYKLDHDAFNQLIESIENGSCGVSLTDQKAVTDKPKSTVGNEPKGSSFIETENTTETTTDIKSPPNPPEGGERLANKKTNNRNAVTLKTFSDECKAKGEGVVSAYKPLLDHVDSSGLPMEFVQLAWDLFKKEFEPGGVNENRRQKDWRRHFYNYVTKNYYRLWWASDNGSAVEYKLTSVGLQTKQAIENARSNGNE